MRALAPCHPTLVPGCWQMGLGYQSTRKLCSWTCRNKGLGLSCESGPEKPGSDTILTKGGRDPQICPPEDKHEEGGIRKENAALPARIIIVIIDYHYRGFRLLTIWVLSSKPQNSFHERVSSSHLKMRKLKLREVKELTRSHTDGKLQR